MRKKITRTNKETGVFVDYYLEINRQANKAYLSCEYFDGQGDFIEDENISIHLDALEHFGKWLKEIGPRGTFPLD